MRLDNTKVNINGGFDKTVLALKAARLQKGLSRTEAASLLGWKRISIEQIENGRCNFSKDRLQKIVTAYGYSQKEFERILVDPNIVLARTCEHKKKDQSLKRKPRRNHYKIVTKAVRVIRILRRRKGITQYEASRLCGYNPGKFGHIEVGRIELTNARISRILNSLGYSWEDYIHLMEAAILRDDIVEEIVKTLSKLDDHALSSAATVIKALVK